MAAAPAASAPGDELRDSVGVNEGRRAEARWMDTFSPPPAPLPVAMALAEDFRMVPVMVPVRARIMAPRTVSLSERRAEWPSASGRGSRTRLS